MHASLSDRFSGNDAAIAKAAGDWLARRDRGFTPSEAAAFHAWEALDPRHAAEFSRLNSTWQALDTADEVPQIMALSHAVDAALERPSPRRPWIPWLVGAAAAAVLALTLERPRFGSAREETAFAANTCRVIPSTARQLPLPDGSVVELKEDALVEPVFSSQERRVRLVRGEAHFTVAKDPTRPFVVEVGSVAFCAVGTVFNVRVDQAAVQLLVTEGKVRVEPVLAADELPAITAFAPLVIAGQRLVVTSDEKAPAQAEWHVEPVTPEELARSLAWKESHFVFDRTPLTEAVAAFNRFNLNQLVVDDPHLAGRKLGGTFQANNLDAFVQLLETGFDVMADRKTEGKIILRGRK